jgi:AcrR family transcriptional regulator
MAPKTEISSRERRRHAIIAIARDIFLKEGYGAASMSRIAAEVGGSKATLYAYFPCKTDLFAAVVETMGRELNADTITSELTGGDLRSDLLRTGLRLAAFVRQPQAMTLQRLVIGEAERFPELGKVFYELGPRQKLEDIGAYLGKAMAEGRLRLGDPMLAAEQFFALCRAHSHHRMLWAVGDAPCESEMEAEVGAAVAVFCDAYSPTLPPLVPAG